MAKIIITAGGTGGHVYPAVALAKTLVKDNDDVLLITDSRGMKFIPIIPEFEYKVISASYLKSGFFERIKSIFKILFGFVQAYFIIKKFKPHKVVGFGGYCTVPVVYVAQYLGIPTFIHEQNAVLGRSNRLLAKKSQNLFLTFDKTMNVDDTLKRKVIVTGTPVREGCYESNEVVFPEKIKILVMGGSQGTKVFTTAVAEAIASLPIEIQEKISVTQQCNKIWQNDCIVAWKKTHSRFCVIDYINDIPDYLSQSDLIISRAGASSVAEIITSRLPAIFIPFAKAAENHQYYNAKILKDYGCASLIEENSDIVQNLSSELLKLCEYDKNIKIMKDNFNSIDNHDSLRLIKDLLHK